MTGNRSVLVLGSTGSIGTQALELIARHPERFTVAGLAAGGGDVALLAEQVRAHHVRRVAVAAEDAVALANKESLVAGGALVTAAAAPGQIVPVDSEHSALAQCLRGGRAE